MRLWADVFSAAGARLGGGPVTLKAAGVTRVLDGVGTIRLSVPGTDARAVALLVNENQVKVYIQPTDSSDVREFARGTIRKVRASGSPSDWSLDVEGPDDLDGLTRISTKLGRKYSEDSVSTIVTDLVGLVSGWSASASGGNTTDARFDGVSVFKAIRALAEQQGLHVRAGTTAKTVEVGAFGTAAGLRLVNPAQAFPGMEDADEIALIESISVEQDSEAVCTRLYPLGAGIGEAWLTLENSTRVTPYTIGSSVINGTTHYYIEDAAATTAYGLIEKVGKFSEIAPLSNSAADIENAANALYDISAAWLERYAARLDSYRVTVKKVRATVRPGSLVRLVYNGVVVRDGEVVNYLSVDDDFWVMEASESVGLEGNSLTLTLASVDRHAMDAARIVIGALEELQIDGVSVMPFFNKIAWVYDRVLDATHPAVVPLRFTNATQRLNRCLLKIRTRSFISTVLPNVTDNLHRHTIIQSAAGDASGMYWRKVSYYDEVTDALHTGAMLIDIETDAFLLQTAQETSDDEITLAYGLQEDTETPDTLRIEIDGTDYTSALGGPWAVGGGSQEIELDITEYVLTEAGGNLHQQFEINITCDSGQGEAEIQIEVYETIQAIAVT